jgi:hypothetical protein
MSVLHKDGRHEFSSDHEYTTVIWVLSDGADVPFSDYFDRTRMHSVKVDANGYARLRAMAAIFIKPYLQQIYLEKVERTLYWGESVLGTSEILSRALDISITFMSKELAPSHEQWGAQLKEEGPGAFKDIRSLRENFPDLLAQEGERIGNIFLKRGRDFQSAKQGGYSKRGDGMHNYGSGHLMIVIGPILSAAVAYLTGTWPTRELKPGDGFKLTFTGVKLTKIEQQWVDLSFGSDELTM